MSRRTALLGVLLVAGIACSISTDASRRLVTYGFAVHPCRPNDCSAPDDTIGLAAVDRGDTVWVYGFVEGGDPLVGDSAQVRLRAECAANVVLRSGASTVRTVPAMPTCVDSTFVRFVSRPPNPAEYRYHQWVVDSAIPPGAYTLEGRMVVPPPDLRPVLAFEVR